MHWNLKNLHGLRVGVICGLLAGFALLFLLPDYSIGGIAVPSRMISAPERIKTKSNDTVGNKHDDSTYLALNRGAGGLSFIVCLSLLRFDLKQNLRTWPVLATGIERSPPSF